MKQQLDRTYILDSMPVYKAIWTLAIPTMMAMLVQVIYNMTDTFFIGKLNDPNMVAAISISMPVFMMIQAFGNIFAVGGFINIEAVGRRRKGVCQPGRAVAFWSALVVCAVVSVIGFIFIKPILLSCGASANTFGFGKAICKSCLWGARLSG